MDLSRRVALVTGGSRGIGRAVAIALAKAGAAVAIDYRSNSEGAGEVCGAISRTGRPNAAIQADVSKADEVARLVATVQEQLGPIDVLINNAGIAPVRSIDDVTEADWDETSNVNLKSAFLLTKAVVPGMRARRWGRIVNMSSTAAFVGGVVGAHYAASKAGMIGLTHGYASRLAKDGITVNAIAPALIETDMVTRNPNAHADWIPMGRFGTVDEVADVVLLLATNGYMTGQTIHVNGGLYMT
jgi:3-oxoacyl-[acyl-carrier protein] reductase